MSITPDQDGAYEQYLNSGLHDFEEGSCRKCGVQKPAGEFHHKEGECVAKEELPYFVELDTLGCSKCGAGKMWRVVGPDGVSYSVTYADEEDADSLCDMLNDAYSAGRQQGRKDQK